MGRYVISKDGTMLPAQDCEVFDLTSGAVDYLLDDCSDSERFEAAQKFYPGAKVGQSLD